MVVWLLLAPPVWAQDEQALTTSASLHKEPEGAPLVSLPEGTTVATGRTQGSWNEATVQGWIFNTSTERTRRDGFDLVVTSDEGENLRRSPNGPVVERATAMRELLWMFKGCVRSGEVFDTSGT